MNTQQARINMVDCQIHPMGVVDEAILKAYQTIPRELFVPEDKRACAYIDDNIDLGRGRCLMEVSDHARMIQALDLKPTDVILDIGGATGYSAAILSMLAETVIAVDCDDTFLRQAQANWDKLDVCNVAAFSMSKLDGGDNEHAPFKAILINGAVNRVSKTLLDQLEDGGRLVTVLREKPSDQGRARIYVRSGDTISSRDLFDCNLPYLPGFEAKNTFTF